MNVTEKTINPELQKQLREKYNPDGSPLRNIQVCLTDILIEFDRVCRKNNIQYWLDLGTLLGAARHNGFIPWDDDLDVCILRKDRRRLAKAMKKDLNPPFSFTPANTKNDNPRRWARFNNNNITVSRICASKSGEPETRNEKIWLDIFLMINATVKSSKIIDPLFGRCYRRKFNLLFDGKLKHVLAICLYPFAQFVVHFMYLWGKVFRHNCYVYDFGSGFYGLRKSKDIFPLKEMEFEGHLFPVPGNYDNYLKQLYGNWETLPSEITSHNVIQIIK